MSRSPIPEAVLQQHVAVLGKTRSGKSSVMRGLVEGVLERGEPVCIVDPKGDWWGIKLSKDGKRPGYAVVIFGGEHADVPINAHAGAHVAELFATGNRPCLIDLGGWMVGERTRFWIDFASTLFKLSRGKRSLVVDEIHNFAPKGKIFDPEAGKALHWTNRLASEGLGRGLAMIFASQRPQKVHNDTLTSAETLIAMRVLHPSDRAAVSDWIKGCGDLELGAQVLASLAQMERGEGWVWSPEIGFGPQRVKFPMFKTYDSFRPQTAEDTQGLKGWAEVDLEDVKAKLASVVKEAQEKDPRLLQARIRELERARPAAPSDAELAGARQEGAKQGYMDALRHFEFDLAKLERQALALHEGILARRMDTVLETEQQLSTVLRDQAQATRELTIHIGKVARDRSFVGSGAVTAKISAGEGSMSKAERLVLTALAQYPAGRAKNQVALLAGYAVNGGGFNNAVSSLRTKGWITRDVVMRATPEGLQALGAFEPLPHGAALLEHWMKQLSKAERKCLEALAGAWPKKLSSAQVANLAGYQLGTGGFNNALSRLRTLELISGRAELKASDDFFQ